MCINALLNLIKKARGGGFEPPCSCEHGISNPTPYQARRPPLMWSIDYALISITCSSVYLKIEVRLSGTR